MATLTVFLGKIVKMNMNLVLIRVGVAVGRFVKFIYEGH